MSGCPMDVDGVGIVWDPAGMNGFPQVIRRNAAGDGVAECRKDAGRDGFPGGAPDSPQPIDTPSTVVRTADVVRVCRELIAENGRMKSAITEAIAILENGSDYEKLHVVGTLRAGLGQERTG